jgi:GDP-L-fucose synthase
VPALIRRFHEAKASGARVVTNWGTGTPRREFLHSDDLAAAVLHLLEHYDDPQTINVGTGTDLTIAQAAEAVADAVGYTGRVEWDASKPDGTPRKVLDVSRINALGWRAAIPFSEGIKDAYDWYVNHVA